jgi:hypothetical protein
MISEDQLTINEEDAVTEIVFSPVRVGQVREVQRLMTLLKEAGAIGTTETRAVSIQMNTEVENLDHRIELDLRQIVDTVRLYINNQPEIDQHLKVPAIRRPYLSDFSPGLVRKIMNPRYKITARGLYDDIIYRQSLERMGNKAAWSWPIKRVRQAVLSSPNPAVGVVVKQTRLRLSSLLMYLFPQDPMSVIYEESGWAKARPLIEWREFNNDFNIVGPFKQAVGLLQAAKSYHTTDYRDWMPSVLPRETGSAPARAPWPNDCADVFKEAQAI